MLLIQCQDGETNGCESISDNRMLERKMYYEEYLDCIEYYNNV